MTHFILAFFLALLPALTFGGIQVRFAVETSSAQGGSPVAGDWIELVSMSRQGRSSVNLEDALNGQPRGRFAAQALRFETTSVPFHATLANHLASGTTVDLRMEIMRPQRSGDGSLALQEFRFEQCLISEVSARYDDESGQLVFGVIFEYSKLTWAVTFFNELSEPISVGVNTIDQLLNMQSLVVTDLRTDSDADGMPDLWEDHYELDKNGSADRDLDPDGDSFSNYVEFLAGTDPGEFTSRLKLMQTTPQTGNDEVTLEWTSVPGRTYLVQGSIDGLAASDWVMLGEVPASAGTSTVFRVPENLSAKAAFYRVAVKP